MNEQKQVSNQQTQPVQTQEPVKKKKGKIKGFFRWGIRHPKLIILLILLVVMIVGGPFLWVSLKNKQNNLSISGDTSKLGFEDIGEMATQSAYCTEINMMKDDRNVFGVHIPFTQSKYIYSYDVVIKAGYDFEKITWNMDKDGDQKIIQVNLPEAKILSNHIVEGSFKVYHEEESIFRPITLEEIDTALSDLRQRAEKNAIKNGLLDNAKENAQALIRNFFAQEYDLTEYQIRFSSLG